MDEKWLKSDFADGRYLFSNYGRVINIRSGKIVKPMLNNSGYYKVTNSFTGKNCYIHREVAKLFIGECPDGFVVNHKDGNRLNNNVCNLEYVSHSYNIIHSLHILKRGRIKIHNDDLRNIYEMYLSGVEKSKIAEHYNCSICTINKHIAKYKKTISNQAD